MVPAFKLIHLLSLFNNLVNLKKIILEQLPQKRFRCYQHFEYFHIFSSYVLRTPKYDNPRIRHITEMFLAPAFKWVSSIRFHLFCTQNLSKSKFIELYHNLWFAYLFFIGILNSKSHIHPNLMKIFDFQRTGKMINYWLIKV